MNGDSTTRLLLAGILVALIVLIVRSFAAGAPVVPGAAPARVSAEDPEWGRYQITSTRAGAPMLLRTDTKTGQVWKLELRGGGVWQSFAEPTEGGPEDPGWARYQVIGTRAGTPMLIRIDTVTGQAWQLALRGGDGTWHPFEEPERGAATAARPSAPEPDSPAPTPIELPVPPTSVEEELLGYVKAASSAELPPDIRLWAIGKLADLDDSRATGALLKALEAEEARVALAAIEALDGRDDDRIGSALEAAAAHPDPSVKSAAAERLGGE